MTTEAFDLNQLRRRSSPQNVASFSSDHPRLFVAALTTIAKGRKKGSTSGQPAGRAVLESLFRSNSPLSAAEVAERLASDGPNELARDVAKDASEPLLGRGLQRHRVPARRGRPISIRPEPGGRCFGHVGKHACRGYQCPASEADEAGRHSTAGQACNRAIASARKGSGALGCAHPSVRSIAVPGCAIAQTKPQSNPTLTWLIDEK